MLKSSRKQRKKGKEKVQKTVELVSLIASQIEEMSIGERMRVTPFAKSIILSNNSHPHVETIKGKLMEAYLWQEITESIKFIKKGDQIIEIEKIDPTSKNPDIITRKEIMNDLVILKDRSNKLEENQCEILKLLKKRNKKS